MIQVYKLFFDIDKLNVSRFFVLEDGGRRRDSRKIRKQDFRKYLFSIQRVIDFWNSLPEDAVSSPSINVFKRRLDRCMERVM